MLFRIVAPHFVAGIDYGKNYAPILRYMSSWSMEQIVEYCIKREWEFDLLD